MTWLLLGDELPRIGSGLRRVEVEVGRKWAHVRGVGGAHRLPVREWERLRARAERHVFQENGAGVNKVVAGDDKMEYLFNHRRRGAAKEERREMAKISLTMDANAMSIEGVREYHNQIVADYGVGETRNGKFPDKATALKRLAGLIVSAKAAGGQVEPNEDEAAAKVKAAKKTGGGTRSKMADDAVIKVVARDRKLREGTETAAMWAKYRDGMTVAQYVKATEGIPVKLTARAYLSYDVRKGFIKVG